MRSYSYALACEKDVRPVWLHQCRSLIAAYSKYWFHHVDHVDLSLAPF